MAAYCNLGEQGWWCACWPFSFLNLHLRAEFFLSFLLAYVPWHVLLDMWIMTRLGVR